MVSTAPTTLIATHGPTIRRHSAMTAHHARQAYSLTWRTPGRRSPLSTSFSWCSSSLSTLLGAALSGTTGRTTRTQLGNEVIVYRLLGSYLSSAADFGSFLWVKRPTCHMCTEYGSTVTVCDACFAVWPLNAWSVEAPDINTCVY
jgi:hypothetical protein